MNRRYEDDYNDTYYEEKKSHGFMANVKKFLYKGFNEDEAEDEDDFLKPTKAEINFPDTEQTAKPRTRIHRPAIDGGNNVVNFRNHYDGEYMEMILALPKDLEGAASVCTDICNGKPCVVSLESVDQAMAQRIADFIGGAVFSLGGDIQRVSNDIFIAAPGSVHISSTIKNEVKKSSGRFFQFAGSTV